MSKSNQTAPASKPAKPYPTFPLTAHSTGRWCKRIRGKIHYFGRWGTRKLGVMYSVDDIAIATQDALDEYLEVKDDLHAGRVPRPKANDANGVTVADACNTFLQAKEDRLESKELSQYTFNDYFRYCQWIAKYFGRDRIIDDLAIADFSTYRSWLAKTCGVHQLAKAVRVTRMVFSFAYESELIDKPIRFGPNFKEPTRKTKRKANRESGKRFFEADELRSIIDAARVHLRAMILLGVNCGFGQNDIANLPQSAIDLQHGWITYPRPKTETDRRCPLWPETIEALRDSIEARPDTKLGANTGYVFLTNRGNQFVKITENPDPSKRTRCDSLSPLFTKLLRSLGINDRRCFYALRHTFETVGGESTDQTAVDAIMGHVDPSMAANYRHRISDERLTKVTDVIRTWLFDYSDTQDQGHVDADDRSQGLLRVVG